MNKTIAILALALGACCQGAAACVIVDFEALATASSDSPTVGASYTEKGFIVTNAELATDGLGSPFYLGGSTYLYADVPDSTLILTSVQGDPFPLISIDLAEFLGAGTMVSVTFTGIKVDTSVVQQTFNLDGLPGFQTFHFNPGFNDLVSVSWLDTADYHAFDNITVPVPATLLLLGPGLLGALGIRGRRT